LNKNTRYKKDILFLILSFILLLFIVYLLKISPSLERKKKEDISEKKDLLYVEPSYRSRCPVFNKEKATNLIKLSLACVDREFPNKPNYVFESEKDLIPPHINTPAFYGCYDWHSAVHSLWSMVRILNLYPDIENREILLKSLMTHLNQQNILAEINFFNQKRNRQFERPYGWGWLLRLALELKRSSIPELKELYKNIDPFSRFISENFMRYLNQLSRPIREGTHQNTAFSMIHLYDYLKAINEIDMINGLIDRSVVFFYTDEGCPINYEPSGEDFISPCLIEADLMRRVLPKDQFIKWFDKFIKPEKLRGSIRPVEVINPKDPRIGHLIGLFYQRGSSIDGILSVLSENDFRHNFFEKMKDMNCASAEEYIVKSGYGGEHWLASFAIFFYTGATLK